MGDVAAASRVMQRVWPCRKYREGPWEHVKAQLVQEKQRQGAQGAAYVLGAKQESPGVFYLAFIINKTPQKEYMSVTPDGVYFRHEVAPLNMPKSAQGCQQAHEGGFAFL